jgi:hypothetical protein
MSEVRALSEALDGLPRLKLTGKQMDALPAGTGMSRFFVDWDEHAEFVDLDAVRALIESGEPASEPRTAEAWKRAAKRYRRMYGWRLKELGRIKEAMRLAGVTLMVPDFRDGSERVVIRVPGEEQRAALAASLPAPALSPEPEASAVPPHVSDGMGGRYVEASAVPTGHTNSCHDEHCIKSHGHEPPHTDSVHEWGDDNACPPASAVPEPTDLDVERRPVWHTAAPGRCEGCGAVHDNPGVLALLRRNARRRWDRAATPPGPHTSKETR